MPHGSKWMPGKRQYQLDMAITWVAVLSETRQLPMSPSLSEGEAADQITDDVGRGSIGHYAYISVPVCDNCLDALLCVIVRAYERFIKITARVYRRLGLARGNCGEIKSAY
jgi:hypothetical protein